MKFRAVWALAVVLPVLSGCHAMRAVTAESCHKPQPYMKAVSVPALKIPPGLTAPNTSDALTVPALKGPTPPSPSAHQPCLDAPPSYLVPHAAAAPKA
jgi:uncharacterized lipoprotein